MSFKQSIFKLFSLILNLFIFHFFHIHFFHNFAQNDVFVSFIFDNYLKENSVSSLELSNRINLINNDIESIDDYQRAQDEEILMNLMASTDIFEMIVMMMASGVSDEISIRSNKGVNGMVEVYVSLIVKGKKTINDVPAMIRTQVEAMLKELGL